MFFFFTIFDHLINFIPWQSKPSPHYFIGAEHNHKSHWIDEIRNNLYFSNLRQIHYNKNNLFFLMGKSTFPFEKSNPPTNLFDDLIGNIYRLSETRIIVFLLLKPATTLSVTKELTNIDISVNMAGFIPKSIAANTIITQLKAKITPPIFNE